MQENPTLLDALKRYQREVAVLHKGYAQECYRITSISRYELAGMPIRDIRSPDIAKFRDQRLASLNPKTGQPISNATVRLELALLSSLWEIGRIEWGICEGNPTKDVRKPKIPPGRDRRISLREERLILRRAHEHQNKELFSIIVLAIETAMRQGEILRLDWEHINLKYRVAHLPETKNGSKRNVPLSIRARDAITRIGVRNAGRVFTYTPHGLKSSWRALLLKCKISDLHFHDLRHEAVSRLFELGTLDMMGVSAISGHKSLSMLKRYTHLDAAKLVKKLDGKKSKGQELLGSIIPYPASLTSSPEGYEVRVLDFDNLTVRGDSKLSAIRSAQAALLKRLMISIRDHVKIPAPDQYLESVDQETIFMLDPMGDADGAIP